MDTLVVLMLMWLKRPKALMSNLKEKGLILAPRSRIKYIIMEKSGWCELNGAGHIVLPWASRKGWMHINCLTLVSSYTVQNPSQGMIPPTVAGSAHSSCATKITPSRHASKAQSLDLIELTVKTNNQWESKLWVKTDELLLFWHI